ncbi:hypothetical protein RWE15_13185 [Virgibacillus halophilus]|uniref:Uncharacterized protein n=1 Tax=Tigheibacillus halophilus TaxID=361280 RepID=A0ABU5C7B3_9BACI|nr:hypothetical protein [Virgibacillus halophilus]
MAKTAVKSKEITILLNGTISAIKGIVQVDYHTEKPRLEASHFQLQYGVLIGITGDLSGKMVFSGRPDIFAYLGQSLFWYATGRGDAYFLQRRTRQYDRGLSGYCHGS